MWWLAPTGAVCLIALPTLYLAATASDAEYRDLWGSPKALTPQTVILAVSGIAVFSLSASLWALRRQAGTNCPWPALSADQVRVLQRSSTPLFLITIAGYLAFAVSGYRNNLRPSTFVRALTGQDIGGIKDALGRITGVTSLTQVGVAFVVVASLVLVHQKNRRVQWQLAIVILLGLVRAALLAERLAVLELVVPVGAVLALWKNATGGRRARRTVVWAPVVLIPLVLVIFGIFEYSRSWVFYRQRETISYPQFVAERLGGYYATAYNNGQLELQYESHAGRVPYGTVEALWTAPGSSLYGGYPSSGGTDPSTEYAQLLQLHGNPQFNSPGGLLLPFVDWGVAGGLVFLAVAGGVIGFLYRSCIEGRPFAVVLFPSLTTGLFELPRYIYWTLGRFTPAFVALCVVGYLVHRSRGPAPAIETAAPTERAVR